MHRLLQRSGRAEASRRHAAPQSSVSKQDKSQRHQHAFSNMCCSVFGKEAINDLTSLPRLKGMERDTAHKRGF